MPKVLHVAAAVITNEKGEILIARRPSNLDQGGLWEFPGGKLAPYETARQALIRELDEEVGIHVQSAQPLIRVYHQYPEKKVLLDVWSVQQFEGDAYGKEGQAVRWVQPCDLSQYHFPEANKPILKALSLPDHYMITGESESEEDWLSRLQVALDAGVSLVQMRAHNLAQEEYQARAEKALQLTRAAGARLILNADVPMLDKVDADGIHLTSERLSYYSQRPIPVGKLLSCACHNVAQLSQAESLQADLLTLSPVEPTKSHPGVEPVGWQKFSEMIDEFTVPVFALGGMGREDIRRARGLGGQGVAGISAFWMASDSSE